MGIDFGCGKNKRHLIVGRDGIAEEAVPGPRAVVARTELPPKRIIWRARQSAKASKGMADCRIDEWTDGAGSEYGAGEERRVR